MPRPKGFPKTGGRKRGSLNKRTLMEQQQAKTIVQAAKEAGLSPLEYMLKVMRDPETPPQRRDDMAKACAPYVHAKLAAVDPDTGKPLQEQGQVNIIVAARQVALLLHKAHKRLEQGAPVETVPPSTSIGE